MRGMCISIALASLSIARVFLSSIVVLSDNHGDKGDVSLIISLVIASWQDSPQSPPDSQYLPFLYLLILPPQKCLPHFFQHKTMRQNSLTFFEAKKATVFPAKKAAADRCRGSRKKHLCGMWKEMPKAREDVILMLKKYFSFWRTYPCGLRGGFHMGC